jgi:hypothetical protein
MILSSYKVFPFSWPGLEPQLFRDYRVSPWGNEFEILTPHSRLHSPVEERFILKSRFHFTAMHYQAVVGRHQGGGLNC